MEYVHPVRDRAVRLFVRYAVSVLHSSIALPNFPIAGFQADALEFPTPVGYNNQALAERNRFRSPFHQIRSMVFPASDMRKHERCGTTYW